MLSRQMCITKAREYLDKHINRILCKRNLDKGLVDWLVFDLELDQEVGDFLNSLDVDNVLEVFCDAKYKIAKEIVNQLHTEPYVKYLVLRGL